MSVSRIEQNMLRCYSTCMAACLKSGQKNEENNKNNMFVRRCSIVTCVCVFYTKKPLNFQRAFLTVIWKSYWNNKLSFLKQTACNVEAQLLLVDIINTRIEEYIVENSEQFCHQRCLNLKKKTTMSDYYSTDHSKEPNICPFSKDNSTYKSCWWLG